MLQGWSPHNFRIMKSDNNNQDLQLQKNRAYKQYEMQPTDLLRHLFLYDLYHSNVSLFFALINDHIDEMLPIIYTPTISEAVQGFSRYYKHQYGLIISFPDLERIDEILSRFNTDEIDIAVVTDGEGVLGIGDQGVGGLAIAMGKLMVYTLCGGINPFRTLPIQLDMGTNNQQLLDDPLYIGWRHKRLGEQQCRQFYDSFVTSFKKHLPHSLLHWEDLGRTNARQVLERYEDVHPSFNDDIQGTGAVTVAAILSAIKKTGIETSQHRFCIFGAGTAGAGIADQICHALQEIEGQDAESLRQRCFLVDKQGLLQTNQELLSFQVPYAYQPHELKHWKVEDPQHISLQEVIDNGCPTLLIGCSAVAGAFDDKILLSMKKNVSQPVILVLSNPTSRAEATPQQIMNATDGTALVATGSPFPAAVYQTKSIPIAQCNNALIFPGLALGMLISHARKLTPGMLYSASQAVCASIPSESSVILPGLEKITELSRKVAFAVAVRAIEEGVAHELSQEQLELNSKKLLWKPET